MGTEIMQRLTLVRMSKFCGIKLKKSKLINEVGALSTTLPSSNQSALTATKDTKLFSIFLYSAAPCCLSILWHKIQSRSFSHPYTSKPPASRSRAVSGVRKCFFIGKWCFCFRGYEVLFAAANKSSGLWVVGFKS